MVKVYKKGEEIAACGFKKGKSEMRRRNSLPSFSPPPIKEKKLKGEEVEVGLWMGGGRVGEVRELPRCSFAYSGKNVEGSSLFKARAKSTWVDGESA